MRRAAAALLAAALAAGACASDDPEQLGIDDFVRNGQGYQEGGHYDQALHQFRKALEIDGSNAKALLGEATCLYWLGTVETSEGGRRALEAEEKFRLLDADDYGENSWKVTLVYGMVHARLEDLWGRKAAAAEKAAAAGDPIPGEEAARWRATAAAHGAAAEKAFLEVLAREDQPLAKNNLTALFFLATRNALRAEAGEDYAAGIAYIRRYEAEVEKSKRLWTVMKKQEPDLAEAYEQKLKAAERQEIQLRDLVANILFKRREFERSIEELDRIAAIDPFRAETFLNRGRNHEELGRFGAAADDYRRFLKFTDLHPGSPTVVEAAERMARCEARAGDPGAR
jgi:tetratricopeptide (TPR) repeat protein